MIALKVQGLVDVRVGSGAYVIRLPGELDQPGFTVTAFEITEARLLFEGEAASLAAKNITDEELVRLDKLVQQMDDENRNAGITEKADHEFHVLIAQATRNAAIANTIEEYWRLRNTSPECALLHAKARFNSVGRAPISQPQALHARPKHAPTGKLLSSNALDLPSQKNGALT